MTVVLNALVDGTIPVAEDFNFNFRALNDAITAIQNLANVLVPAPVGFVGETAAATAPNGWLLCDGAAVSRATYANLFTAIGTTFGVGDGTSTFNVPNIQNRTVFGKGSGTFATLGATGGEELHTLSASELPQHLHGVSNVGSYQLGGIIGPGGVSVAYVGAGYGLTFPTVNDGGLPTAPGGQPHNNTPPFIVLTKIIKF